MKTLFITDEYLPNPSSNGACVSRLASFMPQGEEAFVLSITKKALGDSSDNVFYKEYQRRPASFVNRIFGFCQDDGYVDAIYDSAKHIITTNGIDRIVCLCRPVEPLIAGIKLKKTFKDLKVCGYFLDNPTERMVGNPVKAWIFKTNTTRLLNNFHKIADKIVALKYYKPSFSKIFNNSAKVEYVGLPSVTPPKFSKTEKGENISIVYGGSLVEAYRNPLGMLEIFKKVLPENKSITVDFYSRGCEDILEDAKKTLGEQIKINGFVAMETLEQRLADADFLLNIANDLPDAVPGKLFEYFSTGKPIINYIFRTDDPANEEYEKYPNIFNLYSFKDNDIDAFDKFLKNAPASVPFSQIAEIFADSTPEYTLSKLMQ